MKKILFTSALVAVSAISFAADVPNSQQMDYKGLVFAERGVIMTSPSTPTQSQLPEANVSGTTTITVSSSLISVGDAITPALRTVSGTVGAVPAVQEVHEGGFTVKATALDYSIYRFIVTKVK